MVWEKKNSILNYKKTMERVAKLFSLVEETGGVDWESVAKEAETRSNQYLLGKQSRKNLNINKGG